MSEVCYLICFERHYKHARHYIGTTKNLEKRLKKHSTSEGAKLLLAVKNAGIAFSVVRTWTGGRELEKKLKSYKKASFFCPNCRKKSE